ncbi:hypothetical protein [Nonomuraea fuscirosea]|uniref:hypothetical protein n=1 Tax=Nonomuraea fuscirosea TaxID=1291556 RepID=UPI0033CEDDD6
MLELLKRLVAAVEALKDLVEAVRKLIGPLILLLLDIAGVVAITTYVWTRIQ